MLIDARETNCSSAEEWVADLWQQEQGSTGRNFRFLGGSGKWSLPTSWEAAHLQGSILMHKLLVDRAVARAFSFTQESDVIPLLSDSVRQLQRGEKATEKDVQVTEDRWLRSRLNGAFDSEPVEDGVRHEAESIIAESVKRHEGALAQLKALALDSTRANLAASVLQCVGRQESLGSEWWRIDVVREGLSIDDLEIRAAAVQAAESWGGPGMCGVLQTHVETDAWLSDYIRQVIEDLSA